jgi:hypothetical protein
MPVNALLATCLLLAVTAFGGPMHHEIVERARGDAEVDILLQARSISTDLNGTFWVYHGVAGIEREPQAAAVTALRPDGSKRTYLAAEILPAGALLPGTVGQVYAITPLATPGFYAASAGWVDADRHTANGVVFFSEDSHGRITNYSVVHMPGARAIAAGPRDTAVVAALDPLGTGDTYLATVINAAGTVLTELCPYNEDGLKKRMERISGVRLHQLSGDSVAVLNPISGRVEAHRIFTPETCGLEETTPSEKVRRPVVKAKIQFATNPLWSCGIADVSDLGASEVFPVLGFAASLDGVVTVVRSAVIHDVPRTAVTRYTARERFPSWISDHYWRAALVTPRQVRGLVTGATVWEERVQLQAAN